MSTRSTNAQCWDGCYERGWRGLIVPPAFAHPAKMARGLTERIFAHAIDNKWIAPGSVVVDPFGGVGSTGIVGAYAGMRVVCVELEPRFVGLAEDNFGLHRHRWERLGVPLPVILQGDSRRLTALLRDVPTVPPAPPPGRIDAVVSSPPYATDTVHGGTAIDHTKLTGNKPGPHSQTLTMDNYGSTEGQLGAMRPGDVDAIVGSPPYDQGLSKEHTYSDHGKREKSSHRLIMVEKGIADPFYGQTEGNLGNNGSDTFWSAARDIMQQCHAVLRPGAHAIWVVKRFVRNGVLVDFPGQWLRLCEGTGFELVCHHRAMVTREHTEAGLFEEQIVTRKERKSFFRRLAEKRGSPVIDWEDVLCVTNR